MKSFKIDKAVQLNGRGAEDQFTEQLCATLKRMKVGDSFLLSTPNAVRAKRTLSSARYLLGHTYARRSHGGKARIWRVA